MVEAVFHSSQALFDGFVGDFELLRADAAVMVAHAQAVVAPDEGGAFYTAAGGDVRATFARSAALACFGGEPVLSGSGGAEGAAWGGGEGLPSLQ